MEKTGHPPSTSTPINPVDVINQDTKVWWDCYEGIWQQLINLRACYRAFPSFCPEELVGHQWASLGVEPLPQDLEVLEREKSQSCDVPVIGEGLQDVGQSIEKGKGKQIAYCNGSHHPNPNPYLIQHHLSSDRCNSCLGTFTFMVKATYLWVVPLELLPSHTICWPFHIGSQYIHGHPTHQPTNLMKKEVTEPKYCPFIQAMPSNTTPSEGGTSATTSCTSCSQYSNRVEELESQVVDLTQRVRMSDAHLEAQESFLFSYSEAGKWPLILVTGLNELKYSNTIAVTCGTFAVCACMPMLQTGPCYIGDRPVKVIVASRWVNIRELYGSTCWCQGPDPHPCLYKTHTHSHGLTTDFWTSILLSLTNEKVMLAYQATAHGHENNSPKTAYTHLSPSFYPSNNSRFLDVHLGHLEPAGEAVFVFSIVATATCHFYPYPSHSLVSVEVGLLTECQWVPTTGTEIATQTHIHGNPIPVVVTLYPCLSLAMGTSMVNIGAGSMLHCLGVINNE
ncbi:hypothetical protein EDC04DRAFT_2602343 [Pisolithus marmoratus]|nr:hypothetical protein EDC04DRAFT_2602343 [Pisolithus marmoratus]